MSATKTVPLFLRITPQLRDRIEAARTAGYKDHRMAPSKASFVATVLDHYLPPMKARTRR